MPSSLHPQAKFDPIPPDFDLSMLVEKTPNFDYVVRISTDQIHELGLHEFEKLILLHVIIGGKPLVVEGWNRSLPPWLFSSTWLEDNLGKKQEDVRDIGNSTDMPMTIGHYLNAMGKLTMQWTPTNFRDLKRQRLYLKDIDCPELWYQHLQSLVPQTLFYLNDCVGERGGPGALHERNIYDQLVLGKGVGPAGDLMSNLPPEMRAENMMCYIGHEGTYTPAHREMCASLGQNIMVETSSAENGEKPGSSIWFMTESKDREVVSEYFLSMLGHDIEVESHFAQINAWKKAPFPVYIVEQKFGDFVLIPPLAPHQVWNRGTRTMKVAWNRTTVETLELALHEALPRARMVCRDEQYKCKAIIYYSLKRYYEQLKHVEQVEDASWDSQVKESIRNNIRVKQLKKDFRRLFSLFTEILVSEMFSPDLPKEKNVEFIPFDSHVTCSYCRCNIFNRFLTCKTCIDVLDENGEEDTYDVCMECYAMGRSCGCLSNLVWVEQWQWPELARCFEDWGTMVIAHNGYIDNESPPQTLEIARSRYKKKPVAQICQEQLKLRPWKDISKIAVEESSLRRESTPEIDEEGFAKRKRPNKRKGGRGESQKALRYVCHICKTSDWKWRLAFCSSCNTAYCYGTLWRAFDLKPQTVMEDADWQCPKCLQICSCGKCRKDPSQQAYRPKGTLLGHDTRRVADPRSVESLVDFGRANLFWLRGDGDNGPQTSLRMLKLMEKAQNEKARDEILEEEIVGEESNMQIAVPVVAEISENEMAIDPQLQDFEIEIISQPCDIEVIQNMSTSRSASVPHQNNGESNIEHLDKSGSSYSPVQGLLNPPYKSPYPSRGYHVLTVSGSAPDLPFLDSSASMRDRMMGIGYYQQANDPDKILFDHPDVSTPIDQASNVAYPRLLVEEPDYTKSIAEKRKGETISELNTGEIDPAHLEYYLLQRKQKLADAKKNGNYFITRNQLAGGRPMIVSFPMQKSKEFLKYLEDPGTGQIRTRHNPRNQRTRLTGNESHLGHEDDAIIVRSDVQEKPTQDNGEEGDDKDCRVTLATLAMRKLMMPPALSTSADNIGMPMVKRKPRHPKNSVKKSFNEDFTTSLANKSSDLDHTVSQISRSMQEQPKTSDRPAWTTVNKPSSNHKNRHDDQRNTSPSNRKSDGSCSSLPLASIVIRQSVSPSSPRLASITSASQASLQIYPQPSALAKEAPKYSLENTPNNPQEQITKPLLQPSSKSLPSNVDNGTPKKASQNPLDHSYEATIEATRNDLVEEVSRDLLEHTFKLLPKMTPDAVSKNASEASPKNGLKGGRDISTLRESTRDSFFNSSTSVRDQRDSLPIDDGHRLLPASEGAKPKWLASRPSLYISEDYLAAKKQALRMVEEELEEESAELHRSKQPRLVSSPAEKPAKSLFVSSHSRLPHENFKTLPKAPPGKLLSMAERQALRGKPFKIVAAKSTPIRSRANPPAAVSTTKRSGFSLPSTKKPSVAVGEEYSSPSESPSVEAPSSESDDNSIPAAQPMAKRPRIEVLTGYKGQSKVNTKHVTKGINKHAQRKIAT